MTGYYRMNEWRAKARMILCACAVWSESAHVAQVRKHFIAWYGSFVFLFAAEYYHNNKVDVDDQRARAAAQARGAVIITQPGAQVTTVIAQPIGNYGNYSNQTTYGQLPPTYGPPAYGQTAVGGAPSNQELYPPPPQPYGGQK